MRRIFNLAVGLIVICLLVMPVQAMDIAAPEVPADVQKYMPEDTQSFGEGLCYVFRTTTESLRPDLLEAIKSGVMIVAITLLLSLAGNLSKLTDNVLSLLSAVSLGTVILFSAKTFISIGVETIEKVNSYGRLLIPVLTSVAAANGAVTAASALYVGTILFTSILSGLLTSCVVPLIYIYMTLCIADCALQNNAFKELKKFVKWLMTWSIKTILYVFTGYMGITGVISGSVDSTSLKAAKLTISGAVPVVGGILSDASESILVSAGILKNAAGIYGFLATVAICLGPFLRIGIQYWLLKLTTAICGVFGRKGSVTLLSEMSGAMGVVLAMTGAVCLLLLISIVCFIRSGVL